jgi:hypothetical protein
MVTHDRFFELIRASMIWWSKQREEIAKKISLMMRQAERWLCWLLALSVRQMKPLRTPSYASRTLPIPQMSGRMRDAFTGHLHKGVTSTMHGILTCIKRLTGLCLQSLHPALSPGQNRIPPRSRLRTLTDLPRSRSELVAENALLRQ